MLKKKITGNGIHLKNGDSAFAEIKKRTPHWIHDTREDSSYLSGFVYLPSCTCSECSYHSNKEKDVCPGCGSHMHVL